MTLQELMEANTPTNWTCIKVVQNILGAGNVTMDANAVQQGHYLVVKGEEPGFTQPYTDIQWDKSKPAQEYPGTIYLVDPNSNEASNVAQAAHEAYHAYMMLKSPKTQLWQNEKYVNQMAERWVRKNIAGMALHVALEEILKSKTNYGNN